MDGWRGTDIRRERTYGGSESEGDTEDERMKRYVSGERGTGKEGGKV